MADSCRKNHNDTIIKDERSLLQKTIPLTLMQGLRVRGSWRPNRTAIYWPQLLWSSALCLSRSLLAFSTASYHQLVWSLNSIGGPEGPFCWVVDFPTTSCLQLGLYPTQSGAPSAPSTGQWLSLPPLSPTSLAPDSSDFLSQPSYIIVQSPLNRPLNLWNGMFDRHQAEITVMQFRGHSLPVH